MGDLEEQHQEEEERCSFPPKVLYVTWSGTACSPASMQKWDDHLEKQQKEDGPKYCICRVNDTR